MRISDWSADVCSSDLFSGYFLLIGMMWSRTSSVVACSDTARFTSSSRPQRAISGTTPEVDRVILRLETDRPSWSMAMPMAVATDRKSVGNGRSVAVRVDLGGRRYIKKKNYKKH